MSKNKTNSGYKKLVKCVIQSATSSLQQAVSSFKKTRSLPRTSHRDMWYWDRRYCC